MRRGIFAILSGTAGGQILLLLAAPVISRLYPPGEFGVFSLVNAVVVPLGAVAALRLDLAVPVPDDDTRSQLLVRLGLIGAVVLAGAGTLVVYALKDAMGTAFGLETAAADLMVGAPAVGAMVGIFTVLNQRAIRRRMYGSVARRNLIQAASVAALQIFAGLLGWGPIGLLMGLAGGQALGIISLAVDLRRGGDRLLGHSWAGTRALLREYRAFPLAMAPSALVNTLGLQAPLLIIGGCYGAATAGWLGMTQRILALPVMLVGSALAQVFLGEFGEARRRAEADLRGMFRRTSRHLAVVAVLGALAVVAFGPWAFATVLGPEYRESGLYAQVLAPAMAAQMIASPVSPTIIIMGRHLQQAAWDIARLLVVALAAVGAHVLGQSAAVAIATVSVASVIAYGAQWGLARFAVQSA